MHISLSSFFFLSHVFHHHSYCIKWPLYRHPSTCIRRRPNESKSKKKKMGEMWRKQVCFVGFLGCCVGIKTFSWLVVPGTHPTAVQGFVLLHLRISRRSKANGRRRRKKQDALASISWFWIGVGVCCWDSFNSLCGKIRFLLNLESCQLPDLNNLKRREVHQLFHSWNNN